MDDATKAPDLLPCPFCGGESEVWKGRILWRFRIRCQKCGIGTEWLEQVMDCPTHPVTRLSDRWNRRAILATPTALAASPEVAALLAAAILDAQLRCMERGRLDTPDEIRAAALRGEKEPK